MAAWAADGRSADGRAWPHASHRPKPIPFNSPQLRDIKACGSAIVPLRVTTRLDWQTTLNRYALYSSLYRPGWIDTAVTRHRRLCLEKSVALAGMRSGALSPPAFSLDAPTEPLYC